MVLGNEGVYETVNGEQVKEIRAIRKVVITFNF